VVSRLRRYKWMVRILTAAGLVWQLYAHILRPALDTQGRYDLLKSDWSTIEAGIIALGHVIFRFATSPITTTTVIVFGFGFLLLDWRFDRMRPIDVHLESLPAPSVQSKDVLTRSEPALSEEQQTFQIECSGSDTRMIFLDEDGAHLALGERFNAAGLVGAFTNRQDNWPRTVRAQLSYFGKYPKNDATDTLRTIHYGTWLEAPAGEIIIESKTTSRLLKNT
jgi:hypothetical protein